MSLFKFADASLWTLELGRRPSIAVWTSPSSRATRPRGSVIFSSCALPTPVE